MKRPIYKPVGLKPDKESRQGGLARDRAEEIGVACLSFLAEEPARLGRFLSTSGLEPDDLRARAAEPAMQAAFLDYVLADETLLLVFCAEKRIEPEHVEPARRLLAGETGEGP